MKANRPIVHLVGSVPLKSSESVFRAVSDVAGPYLARLPDGETDARAIWAGYVGRRLDINPALEVDPEFPHFDWHQHDGKLVARMRQLRFKAGVDPQSVKFEIDYAPPAIESFAKFDALQRQGIIPAGVRFQVAIPTPIALAYNSITPRDQDAFIAAYEKQIIGEVLEIAAAVPHDKLSIQWDVCQEVLVWENTYPVRPAHYKEQILSELQRLGDAIPADVDFGYHLCYGSPQGEHLVMPKDAGVMVEILNGLFPRLHRKVQFVHLPVPQDRSDDAFFAPLEKLNLPEGCDLYLGLIHYRDEAGDRRRLDVARRHVRVDGVSCECGWGRSDPAQVPDLLAAHSMLAGYLETAG